MTYKEKIGIKELKEINELKREKKYDDIYYKYGREVYMNETPYSYKLKEKKKLLKDGRFLDIYEKYGEKIYSKNLKKMHKFDVQNEIGIKRCSFNYLFFEKCTKGIKLIKKSILGASLVATAAPVTFASLVSSVIYDNKSEYQNELDEYNKEINKYADYINSLGLTDLEIIVKVINDMWSNIEGYKNPDDYDILGYHRLSLYMDGYGVCRNMADDFTARMNAINPEYEACNLNVYIDTEKTVVNNTKRTIINDNETVNNNDDENVDSNDLSLGDKLIGNHLVTCIKLKKENILLIVDPTNPSIGLLKNGEIYMFSDGIDSIDIRTLGSSTLGMSNFMGYMGKVLESYNTDGNYNELNKKYNIEAQNEVLEEIIEEYDEKYYRIK